MPPGRAAAARLGDARVRVARGAVRGRVRRGRRAGRARRSRVPALVLRRHERRQRVRRRRRRLPTVPVPARVPRSRRRRRARTIRDAALAGVPRAPRGGVRRGGADARAADRRGGDAEARREGAASRRGRGHGPPGDARAKPRAGGGVVRVRRVRVRVRDGRDASVAVVARRDVDGAAETGGAVFEARVQRRRARVGRRRRRRDRLFRDSSGRRRRRRRRARRAARAVEDRARDALAAGRALARERVRDARDARGGADASVGLRGRRGCVFRGGVAREGPRPARRVGDDRGDDAGGGREGRGGRDSTSRQVDHRARGDVRRVVRGVRRGEATARGDGENGLKRIIYHLTSLGRSTRARPMRVGANATATAPGDRRRMTARAEKSDTSLGARPTLSSRRHDEQKSARASIR
eukprot:31084-Pelagococcus_subviridis.AAC.5